MSGFWSWFIIILTASNIIGSWWLLTANARVPREELDKGDTTGHVWDGDLTEYNKPLPRWWMVLFHLTLVFSVAYLILYPGLGDFEGVLGWTQEQQYQEEMQAADERFGDLFRRYADMPIAEIAESEQALEMGQNLYLNSCAACHGSDGRGAPGFPNLADDAWMYGGDPENILTSILDGRQGMMPALGAALGEDGTEQVVAYVRSLSDLSHDPASASSGQERYMTLCVACHGPEGEGNSAMGAPDLTDEAWLYGSDPAAIRQSIAQGRQGVMPAHADILGEERARIVAAYVYQLSRRAR